jgi:hypothetical protein
MYRKYSIKLVAITAFLLASVFTITMAQAAGFKKNNQEVVIKVNAKGCVSSVELASSADNCSGTEFANSCGKSVIDCICMKHQKFVSWVIEADTRFELKFKGPSPFKSNCKFKSANNQKIQCKIDAPDGDYEYDVLAESCPDDVYDPRIVVRR